MASKKSTKARKPQQQGTTGSRPPLNALPPGTKPADTGQPGGGQGRVDVTGIMPEGVRVDPNLTEGHPGYEESGDSEIIPTGRRSTGQTTERKRSG